MKQEKRLYAVSTAHLDTVWRWTLETTIREYLLDTVLKNFYLFQKVPYYTFNFEGAYRYELIEEYYPDLFEQIQDYAAHDQWFVSGSSYENGDVNIPAPEALFRNILLGNNYFQEKFGKRSKDIFLPDCFGFGYALPAVIRHANLKGFTTQKLSWGGAYDQPFDLGIWRGVDGSEVFASTDPRSYRYAFKQVRTDPAVTEKLENSQAKGYLPWTMQFQGDGDKGGSPKEESVLAVAKAIATNDANELQVISAASDQIFRDLDALPQEERRRLPLYDGELVMTDHGAGGYTSRAMSKRLNRHAEQLADRAERACVLANYAAGHPYPKAQLNTAWKRVIAHQFHDDIPGTSIMPVYNRAWDDYFKSLSQFENEYIGAVDAFAGQMDASWTQGVPLLIHNPAAYDRTDCVEAKVRMRENSPYVRVYGADGQEIPSQILEKRGKTFTLLLLAAVPSLGCTVLDVRTSGTKCPLNAPLRITEHTLENQKYRVVLNKNGDIASIIDKDLGQQLLDAPIKLALLRNVGALEYPAWETRLSDLSRTPYEYANTPEFEIAEEGCVRVCLKVTRQAGGSVFQQRISLENGSQILQVENEVEWQSRRTLLKAQFPFTAHSPTATYDLGLGVIRRGNNQPNLYEVPAQKWADISQDNGTFGVTVLSDCKYGWDKPADNTLRLTCIHTPAGAFIKEARQDLQDIGLNRFSFAIFSHSGACGAPTQIQSERYAQPLCAFQLADRRPGNLGASLRFGGLSHDSLILRAVKQAEDGEEIIVRINEGCGQAVKGASLTLGAGIETAREVYASEEELSGAQVKDGRLYFDIGKYEVKTFALTLKDPCAQKSAPLKPLALPYNTCIHTSNQNRQLNIMAASGYSLPEELFPQRLCAGGIPFRLGSPNERYQGLIPRGQTIPLEGAYERLYLLAASVRGDQEVSFQADAKPRNLTIHDAFEAVGQWDMYAMDQKARIKDAVLALELTHTHSPEGDDYAHSACFYLYELDVHGAAALTLPDNAALVILAATGSCGQRAKLATPLRDMPMEREALPRPDTLDKIADRMDAVTIRAGKIADQAKGGKGKGILRNNPLTNVIRSYTKSEW
ncbi:MAG: glycosyl hydrolase-related protein [Clostridiales bacterium]|nr:glycosyl hydrolase-related protein [Clostridiales bacterium]